MENIYKWTIPWVAFSQFEYKWDAAGFISFLKELAWVIDEIPEIFTVVTDTGSNSPNSSTKRLATANKAITAIAAKHPDDVRNIINEIKNGK